MKINKMTIQLGKVNSVVTKLIDLTKYIFKIKNND